MSLNCIGGAKTIDCDSHCFISIATSIHFLPPVVNQISSGETEATIAMLEHLSVVFCYNILAIIV